MTPIDSSLLVKTRLCKFFARGECSRGGGCSFAHGRSELRAQPDFWRSQQCFDFVKHGTCAYGMDCRYAHSVEELCSSTATRPQPDSRGRRQGRPSPCHSEHGEPPARHSEHGEQRLQHLSEELEGLRGQAVYLQTRLATLLGSPGPDLGDAQGIDGLKGVQEAASRDGVLTRTRFRNSSGKDSNLLARECEPDVVPSGAMQGSSGGQMEHFNRVATNAALGVLIKNTFVDFAPHGAPANQRKHSAPPTFLAKNK